MLQELGTGLLAILVLIEQGKYGQELKRWREQVKASGQYKPENIARSTMRKLEQFFYGDQYSSWKTIITMRNGDQYIIKRIYKSDIDEIGVDIHEVMFIKVEGQEVVQRISPKFTIKGEDYREDNLKTAEIEDLNFDGYRDILFIDYGNKAKNYGRYVWLYNPVINRFEYNTDLSEYLIRTGADYNRYERAYTYEVSREIPDGRITSYYKTYWKEGEINEVLERECEKYYDITTDSIIENTYSITGGEMMLQSHEEQECKEAPYVYKVGKGALEESSYVVCSDVYRVLLEKGTKQLEVTFNYKKDIPCLKAESIEIREIGGDFYQRLTEYINQERGDGSDQWKYGLSIRDWNGDGHYDLATSKYSGGSNTAEPMVIWLWDSNEERYVYNEFLSNLSENGSLSTDGKGKVGVFIRSGGGLYDDIKYQWKENEFLPIWHEYTHNEKKGEEWINVTEVYKMENGEWQLIETRINE